MSTTRKSRRKTAGFSRRSSGRSCRRSAVQDVANGTRSDDSLFQRYRTNKDLAAREELIRRFLPMAQRLAWAYQGGSEPLEDLVQVAGMGLVKAVDRFDPARGSHFLSYAVPTITGELKRHFRDASWAVHVPRSMQERVLKVSEAARRLSAELGRSPTPQQVGAATGLPTEEVLQGLEAATAYDTLSLDATVPTSDGRDVTYADSVGEIDPRFEIIEDAIELRSSLHLLPGREQAILYLRFMDGLTQAQIGERIGISQMQVSRLLHRALDRLRILARATPGASQGPVAEA